MLCNTTDLGHDPRSAVPQRSQRLQCPGLRHSASCTGAGSKYVFDSVQLGQSHGSDVRQATTGHTSHAT